MVINKKKNVILTIVIVSFAILLIGTGTYAYWTWTSNVNKNVVFNIASGINEDYIIYDAGESLFLGNFQPTDSYCDSVNTTISFYKTEELSDTDLMATIYMDVNAIGNNISDSEDIYWVITSGDNSISCPTNSFEHVAILNYGTFTGVNAGDTITLLSDIGVSTTIQKYTIWIWIDSSGSNLSSLSGDTLDVNIWTEMNIPSVAGNGSGPVLDEGMIPVTISDDGTVTTVSPDGNWYDYDNHRWANAVLVSNGVSYNSVPDLAGGTGSGIIGGATFVYDGLSFDGTDDFVRASSISIASLDAFTFEAEFTLDSLPVNNSSSYYTVFGNTQLGGFAIEVYHNYILINVYDADLGDYTPVYINVVPEINKRYMVTGVYFDGEFKLYVDGQFKKSVTNSGVLGDPASNVATVIGCNPSGSVCEGNYFDGIIHSVRFYNRALTDSEVNLNYNKNISKNGLYMHYDFKDGKRSLYKGTDGVEVDPDDILAYYVWIPRYKYKLFPPVTASNAGVGNEQLIDIVFEDKNAPRTSGTLIGQYLTHPAFWWDDDSDGIVDKGEMLAGIWVGKFETTPNITGSVPHTILPMDTALEGSMVRQQFTDSLMFAGGTFSNGVVTFLGSNEYGLSKNTDSHMMKNRDWGAVAYLAHSKYGQGRDVGPNCAQYTGCGCGTGEQCPFAYGTMTDYPQSTTENITGVFDMSGGHGEAVMANAGGYSGSAAETSGVYNSGFNGPSMYEEGYFEDGMDFPPLKYYDLYLEEDFEFSSDGGRDSWTMCTIDNCGGHALHETAGWYGSFAQFFHHEPWLTRGYYGSDVEDRYGMFVFYKQNGSGYDLEADGGLEYAWRSVLVIK